MSRTRRIEFTKAQKLEMFKRAGGPERLCCEGCGIPLRGKRFDYDHSVECWERPDRDKLTAEDGKLLGWDCCHKAKTAKKAGERAHSNKVMEGVARARRKGPPIPGSRDSGWKRKMDGTLERR
jgi:hypothetical protein